MHFNPHLQLHIFISYCDIFKEKKNEYSFFSFVNLSTIIYILKNMRHRTPVPHYRVLELVFFILGYYPCNNIFVYWLKSNSIFCNETNRIYKEIPKFIYANACLLHSYFSNSVSVCNLAVITTTSTVRTNKNTLSASIWSLLYYCQSRLVGLVNSVLTQPSSERIIVYS